MSNIYDALKDFRSSLLVWQLHYLLFGLMLLLICNYIFTPSADMLPNWIYFSELQKNVSIVVIAYFFARLCNLIGGWTIGFLFFLARLNFKEDSKEVFSGMKKFLKREPFILNKTSPVNYVEFEEFVLKGPRAEYRMLKYDLELLLMRIILGFFVFLTIAHSYLWSILIIVIFIRFWRVSADRRLYREESLNYFHSQKNTHKS